MIKKKSKKDDPRKKLLLDETSLFIPAVKKPGLAGNQANTLLEGMNTDGLTK